MLEEIKGYEAQLLKLAREYGESTEDGKVRISPEKLSAYLGAKADLDAVEHEVQTSPLKLSVLAHLTNLTPSDASALERFTEVVPDE